MIIQGISQFKCMKQIGALVTPRRNHIDVTSSTSRISGARNRTTNETTNEKPWSCSPNPPAAPRQRTYASPTRDWHGPTWTPSTAQPSDIMPGFGVPARNRAVLLHVFQELRYVCSHKFFCILYTVGNLALMITTWENTVLCTNAPKTLL